MTVMDYVDFIRDKSQFRHQCGFESDAPEFLFGFQKHLTEWALQKGRAAINADCGLGKTAMQLAWSQRIIEKENKPVLIVTPIAVGAQTISEAEKFGIDAVRSRDGKYDTTPRVVVTNYQQLHKFEWSDFAGVVCDESSAIKNAKSQTREIVTEFLRLVKYRLLATATAAPNDYWELGTSSEALGLLGFRDMITTFFKQETQKYHQGWGRTKYRFRGHAEHPFWAWVCSWARSIRKPSDLGFSDDGFVLPGLKETEYTVECNKSRPGRLFPMPGETLQDERAERNNSIEERCEIAKQLVVNHEGASIVWCEQDNEGNMLEKVIPNSVQVSGKMSEDSKEEALVAFSNGTIDRLIIKPKIGAWGSTGNTVTT